MTETFAQVQTPQLRVRVPHFLKRPLLVMILLAASQALGVLIAYFKVQPVVPIFYTLPSKSQSLASKEWLFLFPALAIVITLIHTIIFQRLNEADRVLLKLFAWTSVGVSLLLAIALTRILLIIW